MGAVAAVGHLDADAFYVSAERVRNAFLLGKPVGVLGNQGAFVIAKSYEMKAAASGPAIPFGRPSSSARPASTSSATSAGTRSSPLMLDVVREFSPEVEYYSIDEFFFRVPSTRERSLQETARGDAQPHLANRCACR